ncbi:4Fe-4S binding protein [Planctomycetota bacterium]
MMKMRHKEVLFVILVLLSIVSAWLIGGFRHNTEVQQVLTEIMPEAEQFEKTSPHVYIGLARDGNDVQPIGYIGFSSATGSLGPIEVAAGFDQAGWITSIALVTSEGTESVSRQTVNDMLTGFVGKHCSDPLAMETQRAEFTPAVRALWQRLSEALGYVCLNVASVQGQVTHTGYQPGQWFGLPEIVLILLYVIGFLAYSRRSAYYQQLHWIGLVGGFVFVGIWLKAPMSLENINALLMGYWPSWQTHLYWYLLIGGVLIPIVVTGKSFYCNHVCPFGATQQIIGVLGPVKKHLPQRAVQTLRWLQRGLVWFAVLCALLFRNPAVVRYEVSGTLFGLQGMTWQFVLLAAVLVASLVITRPWCNLLCPIRAITDFIQLTRRCLKTTLDKTSTGTSLS